MPIRLLTFIVFGVVMPLWSSAQESAFALNNTDPDVRVFDASGAPLGPDYLAELWGSDTPESLIPAVAFRTRLRVFAAFSDGFFEMGGAMVVPAQFINGGDSWLQVRAWDSRLGPTYEEVAALGIGGYGESSIFLEDGTDPYMALPDLPAPLFGLESFSVRAVVPEPSTWALLAAGGAIMVIGMRKRNRVRRQSDRLESSLTS